jgi:uncharacterized protein (TIGR02284 family)
MAVPVNEIVSILNTLIETCKDGEEGFREAAEGVKGTELESLLNGYSLQRSQFANELQQEVTNLGEQPKTSSSPAGAVHRGWMNIKAAVTGGDKGAIISECLVGEDHTLKTYEDALKKDLPADILSTINLQYAQIQNVRQSVQELNAVANK